MRGFPGAGADFPLRSALILFCLSQLGLLSVLLIRKHGPPAYSAILLATLTLMLASCLSGCVGTVAKGGPGATTYHMVVTATSGTFQHSLPIAVIIPN